MQLARSLRFLRKSNSGLYGGDSVKKNHLETQLTIFLGYIKRNGATEKELQTVVDTIGLLRKYLPFYKHQEGS